MIALRDIHGKIAGIPFTVLAGREIPKDVLKTLGKPEEIKKLAVETKPEYDKTVKDKESKNSENIKKGESARDKIIQGRKPKPEPKPEGKKK